VKLLIAATSARALAEAACTSGFEVVALDVFGDADTRRAARHWASIGEPATLRIDAGRLAQALHTHAPGALGWVAGSGLEALPHWPEVAGLPLLGRRGPVQGAEWLAALTQLGLPHPPSQATPPPQGDGWLRKDLASCGGVAVRRGDLRPGGASVYWQREEAGLPVSLTFIANGREAVGLGINRQLTHTDEPGRPYRFAGVAAPQPLPAAAEAALLRAARALTARFGLRGLAGLDALWRGDTQDDTIRVLELNARPPASHALHTGPLLAWHVAACLEARLPPEVRPGFALPVPTTASALAHVLAPTAGRLTAGLLQAWTAREGVHDVARPEDTPLAVAAGAPLCTVSVQGPAHDIDARLHAARAYCLADWRAHHVR